MQPDTLAPLPFTEGDTWEGIPGIAILINAAAPTTLLSSVVMRFAQVGEPHTDAVIELSSADNREILISSVSEWKFAVLRQKVPGLTAGVWMWQIKTTDSAVDVTTWLVGSITVLPTV